MPDLDQIVAAIVASKKYRAVCPDTIRRLAARELAHHRSLTPAVKATRRRLHQVYGAFKQDVDYETAFRRLASAYQSGAEGEIKAACRAGLGLHSSTAERLPILDEFYSRIWEVTGRPASILDLGCGLNPLTLPWMGLAPTVQYQAYDIDAAEIAFLNRYLALAGLKPQAVWQDILVRPPNQPVDLALLFKAGPSLERQEPGATRRLLEQLRAEIVVVSFPVKSLGGWDKGMVAQYQSQFRTLAADRSWPVKEITFETELVFVVKPAGHAVQNGARPAAV